MNYLVDNNFTVLAFSEEDIDDWDIPNCTVVSDEDVLEFRVVSNIGEVLDCFDEFFDARIFLKRIKGLGTIKVLFNID